MITIAIPKGSLFKPSVQVLEKIGVNFQKDDASRKLTYFDKDGKYKFIIVRPMDVPVYVEHGAADLGIVGKDVLNESACSIAELVDLKFGYCKLAIAALRDQNFKEKGLLPNLRVATKFMHCADKYFRTIDLKVEIIKLYGSIELAPIVGLSDVIVDLVATGQTLHENGLEIIETIFESTARFISNKVSFKTHYPQIIKMAQGLKEAVEQEIYQ
ncbi:MAG: ATP phosphoribosyltransferase [Candidatus Margulisiibacteriota bacterium]|nr:MAG: ATP phosphoribosyltransferase [Candidatus Margulisbacteria bacterium GWD2_39_127]OGI05333.1 MAG: ATP phosphoribosyltransferase [Candidatus Margulisbacteria bacterium GWF2_38_17]OGI06042.1 MAG: ATP phosphoribosyltransferase [Candidatus Margulisbacteria bacterium GWE2_39_32]PZM77318.1 MAG: ATP phosphoribosyltransferase [Candidatus Margulisiibacteriota bacterium]HAR62566.1 ATP phosphoribosyltransferase [Candidatus Margulisiibacteriota bacterium]